MLTFAVNVRIYLHARPTDMRNSFDGLCALVRNVFQADPLDGSLFLFVNRRDDRLKALWWDCDGLALFYKRLSTGRFCWWPTAPHAAAKRLAAHQLHVLLSAGNPEAVQAAPVWRPVSPVD